MVKADGQGITGFHMARVSASRVALSNLTVGLAHVDVSHVKTLTIREFFHSPTLIKALHPGQSLVVTADGKPNLIVTKAGGRPRKSAEELRLEARRLLAKPGKKVDCVALLRKLRQ